MALDPLRRCLESLEQARPQLHAWGLRDHARGWRNLTSLAATLGADTLRELFRPLARLLPRCADPDMALNNLERYLTQPSAATRMPVLLQARAQCLDTLLQLLSTSQFFSDLLVANPDYLD